MSLMPSQSHSNHQGSQGRLPFQQVNPTHEEYQSTDSLLQQRISERNTLDVTHGGSPMNYQMPQRREQLSNQEPNIHPAMIARFINMKPNEKENLSKMNPTYYQQLLKASQSQSQHPLQQEFQPQPQQLPQPILQQNQFENYSSVNPVQEIESNVSSDLENIHSSEEEEEPPTPVVVKNKRSTKRKSDINPSERVLNVNHKNTVNQNVTLNKGSVFLSLDFRNDLVEIKNDTYVLSFPTQHNVTGLELESCLINRNKVLEREPYIYISISEIEGEYQVTAGHKINSVFGKLIQEKTINEFIVYKPENCIKNFLRNTMVDKLSIKFLRYDLAPIQLNRIPVEKLRKSKDCLKVTTKTPHYLSAGDRVNISCTDSDKISVDMVEILKVLSPDLLVLDNPINPITQGLGLQFDKVDLKCTLTFKIFN